MVPSWFFQVLLPHPAFYAATAARADAKLSCAPVGAGILQIPPCDPDLPLSQSGTALVSCVSYFSQTLASFSAEEDCSKYVYVPLYAFRLGICLCWLWLRASYFSPSLALRTFFGILASPLSFSSFCSSCVRFYYFVASLFPRFFLLFTALLIFAIVHPYLLCFLLFAVSLSLLVYCFTVLLSFTFQPLKDGSI